MKTILYLITNTQTWTVFEKYIYAIKFTFFIVQKSNAKYLARRYYIILRFNSVFHNINPQKRLLIKRKIKQYKKSNDYYHFY